MLITEGYRKDINGLRAIAVIIVIIFHLGYFSNGYLGVDIFFVISGYLITSIVYKEALENRFSIVSFYIRRIRRIIPLVVFAVLVTLIVGLFVMLPDDLENLSQSVIATNLMSNNILLLITTGNYWDISNEFKPLMHTWSLGVEEQFYFILPLLFLLLRGKYVKWILPLLTILTLISLLLFLLPSIGNQPSKFYLLHYRFFEIAIGGVFSIAFKEKAIKIPLGLLLFVFIFCTLIFDNLLTNSVLVVSVALLSVFFMITIRSKIEKVILENSLMQFIGKISFSLYMWHQIVFAYARYFVFEDIKTLPNIVILLVITLLLSLSTYHFIEIPFRDKKRMTTRSVIIVLVIATITTSLISYYIYAKKGIVKNVPELDLVTSKEYSGNLHIKYNERIYAYDKVFTSNDKIKILIVGSSFARDWANVLLESKYGKDIEITYLVKLENNLSTLEKIRLADRIYFSTLDLAEFKVLEKEFNIDKSKVWNIGPKNFGKNNGFIYNQAKNNSYCKQRIKIEEKFFLHNEKLKKQWKDRYVDLIGLVIDDKKTIPVFDNECRLISQDCTHFTQFGAKHYATIINNLIVL
jgi:peptidoglycan/LPS O-acetylase OafA/YrhL